MISFRKFWMYLEQNHITQYELIKNHGIPTSTLAKLRKNAKIETSTIEHLCDALNCQPGDIMENLPSDQVVPKNSTNSVKKTK